MSREFEPIAIVGRACVLPGALSPQALWEAVVAGRDLVTTAPEGRWRLSRPHALASSPQESADRALTDRGGYVLGFEEIFDPTGFNLPAESVLALDPLFQWALHTAREALRDAGCESGHSYCERVGAIFGNLSYPTSSLSMFAEATWLDAAGDVLLGSRSRELAGVQRPDPRNRFMSGLPAHLLAHALGFGAGTFALDAACASSLYAIKLACDQLHDRRADMMLAGAVNRPDALFIHIGFSALKALSPSGRSRPFHRDADGLLPAEGAAFVVLKRLSDAVTAGDHIFGVLRGIGLSNDGRSSGLLVPSFKGQACAMRAAFEGSGLRPGDVSLLECHATGTPAGDPVEIKSSAEIYAGAEGLPIGSLKSNMGHLITAAGVAGLLKVIGAMETGVLPPTLHASEPLPSLRSSPFRLLAGAEPWTNERRVAGLSAFGFGGNNAHFLLENWRGDIGAFISKRGTALTNPDATERGGSSVAVVGLGVRSADLIGVAAFAHHLFTSRSCLRRADGDAFEGRTEIVELNLSSVRFPPRDLEQTLPQQLLLLAAAEEAAQSVSSLPHEQTGIFVGMGCDPQVARLGARWRLHEWAEAWACSADATISEDWLRRSREAFTPVLTPAGVVGNMPNVVANRLNSHFDVAGLSFTVSSEELSGLTALRLAARALLAGELDAAFVGAVDLCCDEVHQSAARELFAEDRRIPGDAAIVLALKRADDARRDGDTIYALIADTGEASTVAPALRLGLDQVSRNLTSLFGHAHAASGLMHVAAAVLACHHRALPIASHLVPVPWLSVNSLVAEVSVDALGGQGGRVQLRSDSETSPASLVLEHFRLHVYSGSNRTDVLSAFTQEHESEDGPARLVIVAGDERELAARRARARALLAAPGRFVAEDGIYYRESPIGGEVGFVFTGAAASYDGMGSELLLAFPDLTSQVLNWMGDQHELKTWWYENEEEHVGNSPGVVNSLWSSTFLSQVHSKLSRHILGLEPSAALGYSSGEANALFALDAWSDLAAMVEETSRGGLFTHELGGEFAAIHRWWKARETMIQHWSNWVVAAPVARVRAILATEQMVHLAVINTANSCVITGEQSACERVIAQLGAEHAQPLDYHLAVHCPEVEAVADEWLALHSRHTQAVEGLRFYSAGVEGSYVPTRESAAQAIYRQAVGTLDFPRMVLRAWEDGVRVFVEHGPRGLCSGWIRTILGNREHVSVSLDLESRSSLRQAVNATAELLAAGVSLNHRQLTNRLTLPLNDRVGSLQFAAHPPAVRLPALELTPLTQPPDPDNPSSDKLQLHPHPLSSANAVVEEIPAYQVMIAAPPLPSVIEEWSSETTPTAASTPDPLASLKPEQTQPAQPSPPQAVVESKSEATKSSATNTASTSVESAVKSRCNEMGAGVSSLAVHHASVATIHQQFLAQQSEISRRFLQVRNHTIHSLFHALRNAGVPHANSSRLDLAAAVSAQSGPAETKATIEFGVSNTFAQGAATTVGHPLENAGSSDARASAPRLIVNAQSCSPTKVDLPVSEIPVTACEHPGPQFTREQLKTLASGKVSSVFGSLFEQQDGYDHQVRMPDEPMLLADRVRGIDAVPGKLGRGTIWTETDVGEDSWYLNDGYMPAGLMIEAGQADLLLISWMGIDFLNRGQRAYRLLGCELTFHGSLPAPGDRLCYDIHIDDHAQQGEVRLFFFHYDCRVNGELRLSARHGQAGFFTATELADSAGVIWDAQSSEPDAHSPLPVAPLACRRKSFSREEVRAFSEGNVWECFAPGFEISRSHVRTPKIQSGRMLLLEEVTHFDPAGGPWGRGYLRATQTILPDAWFFDGHFKNDPCMPGSLMLEGCYQALSFYLTALGFTLDRDGWRFEPIPDEPFQTQCRVQVLPSSRELSYEVFIRDVTAEPIPQLRADVLCTVDGRKAFLAKGLSIQLIPDWPLTSRPELLRGYVEPKPVATINGFALDYASLLACAWGRPSEAFGPAFRDFDGTRRVSRLPGPPYHFFSRATSVHGSILDMKPGLAVEVEYDIPPDAWYFKQNGNPTMPFAVLMEATLQPCGWLACLAGCPLSTQENLYFRNLDGTATVSEELRPDSGTLRSRIELTNISNTGGVIIVSFEVSSYLGDKRIYVMNTVFGFFPKSAMENQVGLPTSSKEQARLREPSDFQVDLRARPRRYFDGELHMPEGMLLMLDRVTGFWPTGGSANLGHLRAEKDVNPSEWFFKSHFFQDPVQPGSLGVEAMLQLLQFYMLHEGLHEGVAHPRFEPIALERSITWKYRGQIVPLDKLISTEMSILEVGTDDRGVYAVAEAWLWIDGRRIYHAKSLTMRIVSGTTAESRHSRGGEALEEVLNPDIDTWLKDHRPTFTLPALPMMSMVERLAAAAQRRFPGLRVVGLSDVQVKRWITFPCGARRLRTSIKEIGEGAVAVSLEVWREAAHVSLSRFEVAASAKAYLAAGYPDPPTALSPIVDAELVGDPYAAGKLFHGPAFQILRHLSVGARGSSASLDAGASGAPINLLNQVLLDGATHAIPHDELTRWCGDIAPSQVAYPHRIEQLALYGPTPVAGEVRCEVRFAGFADTPRHPAFHVQLIANEEVWADFKLVEILFPKGPIGNAEALARRAFLRDQEPIDGLGLSDIDGTGTTSLTRARLQESDWLPGTVAHAYGCASDSDLLREVAIKDHLARPLGIHPARIDLEADGVSARSTQYPLNRFTVHVTEGEDRITVRDAGPAELDFDPLRRFWRRHLSIGSWPIEDVHFSLIERFVRRVVLADPDAFDAVRGRSLIYFGNHQVGVESLLFSTIAASLSEVPILTLAKAQHQTSWLGRFIAHGFSYPGMIDPEAIIFFEREDQQSQISIIEKLEQAMTKSRKSLMVHVEGTRSFTCRHAVEKMSSAFLDLALKLGVPIIPVRFIGGLPVQPVQKGLEFPVDFGRQDYWIGRPILPEELAAEPYRNRRQTVLAAINALGPPNTDETPFPGDADFAHAVEEWQARTGASAEHAVLYSALTRLREPGTEIQILLAGATTGRLVLPDNEHGRWLAELASRLFGPRGPKVALIG